MSKIALNSNASGTGVFTIASPNSDTDRTLTLPDSSGDFVLSASGVISDFTSTGIDDNATSTAITIDSSQRVTMAYQPAFHARLTSPTTYSNNSIFGPGTVSLNIGSHYSTSTGLFTAPVAGVYMFYASFLVNGGSSTSTYLSAQLSINGSANATYGAIYANNFQIENNISGTFQILLSAGDTVGIALLTNANVSLFGTESMMGGRLLG